MPGLYRWVGRRRVVVMSFLLMAVAGVLFMLLGRVRPAGTPGVVSLELAFSAAAFGRIVDAWGSKGVRAYRDSTLYVDYWFPLAYALFLSGLVGALSFPRSASPSKAEMVLFALPMLAAGLDWIENTLHLMLLRGPEGFSPALVCAASCAAAVKWGLLVVAVAAIAVRVLRRLSRRWAKVRRQ